MLLIMIRLNDILRLELVNMLVFHLSLEKGLLAILTRPVSFDDFSVFANSNSNFHFELKESLFILRDNPVLNKNITSVPLQLFG